MRDSGFLGVLASCWKESETGRPTQTFSVCAELDAELRRRRNDIAERTIASGCKVLGDAVSGPREVSAIEDPAEAEELLRAWYGLSVAFRAQMTSRGDSIATLLYMRDEVYKTATKAVQRARLAANKKTRQRPWNDEERQILIQIHDRAPKPKVWSAIASTLHEEYPTDGPQRTWMACRREMERLLALQRKEAKAAKSAGQVPLQ